jgi:hypothetical protein
MVRRVPGQMQNVEREALDPDRVAVSEFPIRREVWIDEGIAEAGNTRAARRSRWPERGDCSAGQRLQAARPVAMIAMTMRNENISEALALDGSRDRIQMAFVGRTRIDDGDLAASDDVAVGAEKRVGPGIVGDDAPNAGADLLGHAIIDILAAVEGKLRRHDLRKLFVFSLIAPIVAERIRSGSAALLAALSVPSDFAENKAPAGFEISGARSRSHRRADCASHRIRPGIARDRPAPDAGRG